MLTEDDISGRPLFEAGQAKPDPLAQARAPRGGVVLGDNDNRCGGHRLDRHEHETPFHRLGEPQQIGEPRPVPQERQQGGILRVALQVLGGASSARCAVSAAAPVSARSPRATSTARRRASTAKVAAARRQAQPRDRRCLASVTMGSGLETATGPRP